MKTRAATPTKARGVRVADLPETIGRPATEPRPFLYCQKCGGQYAAGRGDYFMLPADHLMTCANGHRAHRLILATERRTIAPWMGAR